MFERFTRPARTVVESAASYAREAAARETRPEHLLRGILDQEHCLAVRVLEDAGAPAERLRARLTDLQQQYVDGLDADDAEALRVIGIDLGEVVRRIERLGPRPPGRTRPRFSRAAKKVLELSLREALAMRHNYIGTEHLLLGLARADDRVVSDALGAFGLESRMLREAVAEALRRAG
ncbi:MAG TPA: Clp protease N-terminal domain-containing protein [Nocardioidaceae bacterium]|nr:Clp protease N-terminal domain-containing protein [Nocardioidaceae bacterium]